MVFALGIATNVVPGMVTYYNEMDSANMECQTGVGLWLITYNFEHNWDAGCKSDAAHPMYCRMDSADVTLNNCPIKSANYDTPCCVALAAKCRAGKGFGVLGAFSHVPVPPTCRRACPSSRPPPSGDFNF